MYPVIDCLFPSSLLFFLLLCSFFSLLLLFFFFFFFFQQIKGFKFGLLFAKEGQTKEDEMFSNGNNHYYYYYCYCYSFLYYHTGILLHYMLSILS